MEVIKRCWDYDGCFRVDIQQDGEHVMITVSNDDDIDVEVHLTSEESILLGQEIFLLGDKILNFQKGGKK